MKEYISLFETTAAYNAAKDSLDLPNVSYCEDQNDVHYNPYVHDYADDYLTFVAKEDGTFTFTPKNSNIISYSTNGGKTWTEGNSVSVNSGDKVLWKGTMTPSTDSPRGIGIFSSTANFDVEGNVMSLLYGDDFKGQINLSGKNYAFYELFYENTKVINANNLLLPTTTLTTMCYDGMFSGCTNLTTTPVLPATTLAGYCYYNMFSRCTSLTIAPELPITTLTEGCYGYMFYGCSNLNYIKAMFTTTPSTYYTRDWVNGVASNGTFIKNSAAQWDVSGTSGIPTGWTVQTASE